MSVARKNTVVITEQRRLTDDIFSLWFKAEDIAFVAKPGQFVALYCKDGSRLLPRPISICEINKQQGTVRLVYRAAGKGTQEIAELRPQDTIDVMGPLGNGFTLEDKKAILIGGGIGIPPMLELAKQLNCEKQIVLGFRDVTFLEEEFAPYGEVYLSTEDGGKGTKGNVLDAIRENKLEADIIYACGPTPMLRGIRAYAQEQGIICQLSLEERMACGIGACLACVCKTKEVDSHTNVKNARVCKDGPVFYAEEVEL
jgi:dihydroorotate dehydrogenase electron transfer subunit